MIRPSFIVCSLLTLSTVGHTASETTSQQEIEHLITFISQSDCLFTRNGTHHQAADAVEHIKKKYDYVENLGLIDSAEDFIKYSASESSFSGEKYTVTCDKHTQLSEEWLHQELDRLRRPLATP